MTHSPAPWRIEHDIEGLESIWDADSRIIADAFYSENPSDAALIAAAPELLEACKAMLRYDESKSVPASMYRKNIEQIKSAIAKAEPK